MTSAQRSEIAEIITWTLAAIFLLEGFFVWALIDNTTLYPLLEEDTLFENLTAVFYGLASVGFLLIARRSVFLRNKKTVFAYFWILMWALLVFTFMGEEISWGQRIFGIQTPGWLDAVNVQHETTFHNIGVVDDNSLGGYHRWLSIFMILNGLVIPTFAETGYGKRVIQWWGFPVVQARFWLFFVGAYLFGVFGRDYTFRHNDSAEIREFVLSVGLMLFALYGAYRPWTVFRTDERVTRP